ncbi:MAG TPA: hypothetical protein VEQ66_10095 [Propionibacteriaceae bacterium]|nr:hypothetical protein [Propionibacteriaceae bacterium]
MTSRRDQTRKEAEERSLDFVQRVIISALLGVVLGSFSSVLALYLVVKGDEDLPRDSVVGLWFMTGVIGVVTSVGILVVQGRRPYSPWVVLGLLPMAISAYWIFGWARPT